MTRSNFPLRERHRRLSQPSRALVLALLGMVLLSGCLSSGAVASEGDRIAEVLKLKPGMRVADVGAGGGEWSEKLLYEVGETGHVYATEVKEDNLEEIRDRLGSSGFENFTVVHGDDQDTGLPEDCCDAILLRLVYHHLTDPAELRASLHRSLRPGGLLAVVEISPQSDWRDLPGVPERGGHGISLDDLVEEMASDGLFEMVDEYEDWPSDEEDHYCVVFR